MTNPTFLVDAYHYKKLIESYFCEKYGVDEKANYCFRSKHKLISKNGF
jgi:hypothetical protein